jgi:hypothetical protein
MPNDRFRPIAVIGDLAKHVSMTERPHIATTMFYVAFALWFTATRYSGAGFYAWLAAPIVQDALTIVTVGLFCVVAILVVGRGLRAATFRWSDVAIVGCSLLAFDLFWRFYLSPHAWDAFEFTSAIVDAATPLVAALGLAALVAEWRRGQQLAPAA